MHADWSLLISSSRRGCRRESTSPRRICKRLTSCMVIHQLKARPWSTTKGFRSIWECTYTPLSIYTVIIRDNKISKDCATCIQRPRKSVKDHTDSNPPSLCWKRTSSFKTQLLLRKRTTPASIVRSSSPRSMRLRLRKWRKSFRGGKRTSATLLSCTRGRTHCRRSLNHQASPWFLHKSSAFYSAHSELTFRNRL